MAPFPAPFTLRPYADSDRDAVIDLFIRANRDLAPAGMKAAFEIYVARSIAEEIGRIGEYYDARGKRSFWVATDGKGLLGNFGLEPTQDGAVELRRMYVDLPYRRAGIARAMLQHAETCARQSGFARIVLSTSELQQAALALYHATGFSLVREEIAHSSTHRTVGNGIRRFYLAKSLTAPASSKTEPHGHPSACSSEMKADTMPKGP